MPLVRITPLKDFSGTALSTTDNGTAFQLGAPSTGQRLYSVFQLTEGFLSTARVLDLRIQSASSSGFGGATDRVLFTRSTSPGAEWGTPVANLSTDHTWWRARYVMSTTASTGGSWKGIVGMGFRE